MADTFSWSRGARLRRVGGAVVMRAGVDGGGGRGERGKHCVEGRRGMRRRRRRRRDCMIAAMALRRSGRERS